MGKNEDFFNDSFKLSNKMKKIFQVNTDDEQEKQVFGAYMFGMINGIAQEKKIEPIDVQAVMVRLLNESLNYSLESSVQFAQFLIESTDREYHPTMFAIIHRGLNGYFMYSENKENKLQDDFSEIMEAIKKGD